MKKVSFLMIFIGINVFLLSCKKEESIQTNPQNNETTVTIETSKIDQISRLKATSTDLTRIAESNFAVSVVGGEASGIVYSLGTSNYSKYSEFVFLVMNVPASYSDGFRIRCYSSSGQLLSDPSTLIWLSNTSTGVFGIKVYKSSLPAGVANMKLMAVKSTTGYYAISAR